MTIAGDSVLGASPADQGTWRAVLPRWRGLTREETVAAFALACGLIVLNGVMFKRHFYIRDLVYMPLWYVIALCGCFTLVLGVVAADGVENPVARRVALVLAVVVSGLAQSAIGMFIGLLDHLGHIGAYLLVLGFVLARAVRGRVLRWTLVVLATIFAAVAFILGGREALDNPAYGKALDHAFRYARFGFYQWLLLTGAATFAYLDWRRTRVARARRHAAELERARSAKHALESRLQAMQARVEPQFLVNTLAQVKALQRVDPTEGARMLDELIAYLRAAMPKMRDTSSTVGQEIELLRAYLAVVGSRPGGLFACEIDPPDARVAEARMPPMVLLPLVDHALAHERTTARPGLLRLRTRIAQETVLLEASDHGSGLLPRAGGAALDAIRERLTALYGDGATLDLRHGDGTTALVLVIPYETERFVAPSPGPLLPANGASPA